MKKYIITALFAGLFFSACKKKYDDVSQQVTVSYPTVTLTGSQFYSINVGGTLPTVSATAYDSTLHESYPVSLDQSGLDNTTPGLYILQAIAKNKYGYTSSSVVYVAVTNVSPSTDLSGVYKRTSNSAVVNVTKLANGLYSTDDVGGAPTLPVTAYFAHLDDTTIVVPPQPTDVGTLSCDHAKLHMAVGDTSYSYIVRNGNFGTSVRTFVKQ